MQPAPCHLAKACAHAPRMQASAAACVNALLHGMSKPNQPAIPSAATRHSFTTCAANPRSRFVAHSHTLTHTATACRVSTRSHSHTHDARHDQHQITTNTIANYPYIAGGNALKSIIKSSQSGIQAGDGGFQVNVQGNTTLLGAVITSTAKAQELNLNSFQTGTRDAAGNPVAGTGNLTITNINNSASYSANSSGITLGVGTQLNKTGAGVGNASGNANSITVGGITAIAGDKTVTTGKDTTNRIAPIFNANTVRADVNAQVQITTMFGQQAIPAASTYSDRQALDLRRQADAAGLNTPEGQRLSLEAARWDEGGAYRTALYGGIGALTGGAGGAAGAVAGQTIIPAIGEEIAGLNLPEPVRQGLTLLVSTGVGALVGGAGGVAAIVPQTAYNYVSHSPFAAVRRTVSQENARLLNQCGSNCTLEQMRNMDRQLQRLEAAGNLIEIGQRSTLTTQQALQLGETLASLLPVYGTPVALYQAITGKGIATQTDLTAAERLFNGLAAAIPLTSAAYNIIKSAATSLGDLAVGFRMPGTAGSSVNVWSLDPFSRGTAVERILGQNLPDTMPVIDKFSNGVATSIKSIDLNASTYQSASSLNRLLTGYIDDVAAYVGTGSQGFAGVVINKGDIASRSLTVALPSSGSGVQQGVLQAVINYGASKGVQVNFIVLP